nr:mgtE [Deltaproteobacteria bacterium]
METDTLLATNFAEDHPSDAARVLEGFAPEEASAYLDELPPRSAAEVLQKRVSSNAAECIAQLSPPRFARIIAALPLDRAAALLRQLDPGRQADLLKQAPSDISALLASLLRYPENSAGALMDPLAMALPEDITATEAMARVRRAPRHALYYIYVINREQKLVGVMNLRELMMAPPKETLRTAMRREVATLPAAAGRLAIVEHPGWRDVHALPVVDDDGIFLGVLRYETLRKLERESAAPPAPGGGLAAVLTLGELCWVGLAGILTDLTSAVAAPTRAQKETAND